MKLLLAAYPVPLFFFEYWTTTLKVYVGTSVLFSISSYVAHIDSCIILQPIPYLSTGIRHAHKPGQSKMTTFIYFREEKRT